MFVLFLLLINTYAFANPSKFTCKFEAERNGSIIFVIENLQSRKLNLLDAGEDSNGYPLPIISTGNNQKIYSLAMSLNSQGGEIYKSLRGNLYLYGDEDGCDIVTLYLYKNTDYKFGYIKADYRCNELDPYYSKVNCTID